MLEINLFITTTVYDSYNIIGPKPNDAASTCLNYVIDEFAMDTYIGLRHNFQINL